LVTISWKLSNSMRKLYLCPVLIAKKNGEIYVVEVKADRELTIGREMKEPEILSW